MEDTQDYIMKVFQAHLGICDPSQSLVELAMRLTKHESDRVRYCFPGEPYASQSKWYDGSYFVDASSFASVYHLLAEMIEDGHTYRGSHRP